MLARVCRVQAGERVTGATNLCEGRPVESRRATLE